MSGTAVVSFEDSVKARVKSIIGELIPEEQWTDIVERQVSLFKREELPRLVMRELSAHYVAEIKEVLNSPEWKSNSWGRGGHPDPSPMVAGLIKKHSGDLLVSVFGGMVQSALQSMNYRV